MALGSRQKALEINLNNSIYGTFAEIGAGQEVARHFFRAGGAAGTIAKSISAYDMTVSDSIYGKEKSGRYVCEDRLHKMLDHEYNQLIDRLTDVKAPETKFFSFADTMAAKSFKGTGDNHGYLGIKFQHAPKSKPSEVIMHIKMLDAENIQQQEAIGLIGVNLLYGVYYYAHDRELFVSSLMDGLSSSRIQIDMIRVSGDAFSGVDSRLLSLELVKRKLCEAVIFDPNGKVGLPSDLLYKKNLLVLRGSFRPPTLLGVDMLTAGMKQFQKELSLLENGQLEMGNVLALPEISMSQLIERGEVDNEDFLARVGLLSQLGYHVLISNSESYAELNIFFNKTSKKNVAFVMATFNFKDFLNKGHNSILTKIGALFEPQTKVFIYPAFDEYSEHPSELVTLKNMPIKDEHLFLILMLMENRLLIELENFNPEVVPIWSRTVLNLIQEGQKDWEKMVPKSIAKIIKSKKLFGYRG